ncbi:MAG: hypothetical protein ACM3N4_12535, partial [Nitrososphaerota archaeon]
SDDVAVYRMDSKLPPLLGEHALTPVTFADAAGNGLRLDAVAVQPDGQMRLRWTVLGSATTTSGDIPWYRIASSARADNGTTRALSLTDCHPTRWHAGETIFTWIAVDGAATTPTLLIDVRVGPRDLAMPSIGPVRLLTGSSAATPKTLLRPQSGTVTADGALAIPLANAP